jgi:hypothetical protein
LQFFCEIQLFVLSPWADQVIDVYVPVIERLEDAMIAARKALLESGWSTNPKSYIDRAFPRQHRPQARRTTRAQATRTATKSKPQAALPSSNGDLDDNKQEGSSTDESMREVEESDAVRSPPMFFLVHRHSLLLAQYDIVSVNQTKNLAKRVWTDSNHARYTWEEASHNPPLATAIIKWQLEHHISLRTIAVNAMVQCRPLWFLAFLRVVLTLHTAAEEQA